MIPFGVQSKQFASSKLAGGNHDMANMTSYPLSHQEQNEKEHEGIVVWDKKGVVVLWPDGHRSRLSWSVLRQACQCLECQKREQEAADDMNHLVQLHTFF